MISPYDDAFNLHALPSFRPVFPFLRATSALHNSLFPHRHGLSLAARTPSPDLAMRLFLLPISTRRALLYAQRLNPEASANASLLDRVTGKAATTWTSWERADAGWKKTVVGWGNAAFARIPYQEWGLKSVPRLRPRRDEHRSSAGKDIKVALAYPERLVEEPRVVEEVQKLGERGGYHRQWMGWSLVGIPFTAPVALVPM